MRLYSSVIVATVLAASAAQAQNVYSPYTQDLRYSAPMASGTGNDFVPRTVQEQEQNGIRYISGGVGEEEMAQIESQADRFNLRLLNTGRNGEYVGAYNIRIIDREGQELFNGRANGPLFLVNLPAGTYTVTESMNGNIDQTRKVTVGSRGSKEVRFYWQVDA